VHTNLCLNKSMECYEGLGYRRCTETKSTDNCVSPVRSDISYANIALIGMQSLHMLCRPIKYHGVAQVTSSECADEREAPNFKESSSLIFPKFPASIRVPLGCCKPHLAPANDHRYIGPTASRSCCSRQVRAARRRRLLPFLLFPQAVTRLD
jgi:hypothetical protein